LRIVQLIALSQDEEIRILSSRTKKTVKVLITPNEYRGYVKSMSLVLNKGLLVNGSHEAIRVLKVSTGQCVFSFGRTRSYLKTFICVTNRKADCELR
jgi:hypothetical protein